MPNSRNDSRLRAHRKKSEYSPVKAASTYFFCPAGPQHSVVSPNPAMYAAVISALISFTTPATASAACARQEWMNPGRDLRAGHVRDQPRAPLNGHVLEDDQVYSQSAQDRPDRRRRVRHALRPRRDMHVPAAAADLVQVMLNTPRGQRRHPKLLQGSGHTQVRCPGKIRPGAIAGPGR